MSIQLIELAILDIDSGKQVLSKEGKTRQVYKETPVTVEVEAGQVVTESYKQTVSLSGILTKTDRDLLDKLSYDEKRVQISGYSDGYYLHGYGTITKDGAAYKILSEGSGGYDKDGKLASGMIFSKVMLSTHKDPMQSLPLYFPFSKEITASITLRSEGLIKLQALDKNKEVIEEVEQEMKNLPKHCSKVDRVISMQMPEKACYLSVDGGETSILTISTKIA